MEKVKNQEKKSNTASFAEIERRKIQKLNQKLRNEKKKAANKVREQIGERSGFDSSYQDEDRIAARVLGMLNPLKTLTAPELDLALTMLDPGHSATKLYNTCAFPDTSGGVTRVQNVASQVDLDLPVDAGQSLVICAVDHPCIAFIYRQTNLSQWYAFPQPYTLSDGITKNPGFYINTDRARGRRLASGVTVTNHSVQNLVGGTTYGCTLPTQNIFCLDSSVASSPVLNRANCTTFAGVPLSASDILGYPGYFVDGPAGAYVVAAPRSWDKSGPTKESMFMSSNYTSSVLNATTDLCNSVYTSAVGVTPSPGSNTSDRLVWSPFAGNLSGRAVTVPFWPGNTDVPCVVFSSPSGAIQTLHVKIHTLYEFDAPALTQSATEERDNPQLVQAIEKAFRELPRCYPSSYNSWGAISNWFKGFYKKVNDPLKKLVGEKTGPFGPLINSSLDYILGEK